MSKQKPERQLRKILAITAVVVPGIFATVAVPAYATEVDVAGLTTSPHHVAAPVHGQKLVVPATVTMVADIHRDSFGATSQKTLDKRRLQAASVGGTSLVSFLADPPQPHFSLAAVVATAEKYRGVPYVFGGESPKGFDCSGFVAYVYAQFGVALPHSSAEQAAIGTRIAPAAARPGDAIVMDGGSHIGIYLGGGRMIDAPEPGRVVSERAIYDSDYYFVRFGI